ncbi:hypothetical protein V8D89_007568 [Ganoderma adspersum]
MFVKSFASLVLLTALCIPHASAAIMSLYLPQGVGVGSPLTADPIGVDKSGHTTWRWGVGTASGTFTVTSPGLAETSATLIEGATDFQVIGVVGATSVGVSCALPTSTASGGVIVASCVEQVGVASVTTSVFPAPSVSLTPVPVQVSDNFKASGAGSLHISLGGIAVSALAILGTARVMLV